MKKNELMLPKHSGSGLGIGECLWHWPQLAGCAVGPRVAQVAQLNNSLMDITVLVANLRFFSFSMHSPAVPWLGCAKKTRRRRRRRGRRNML